MVIKPRTISRKSFSMAFDYDTIAASGINIVLNAIFEKHEGLGMLPEGRYFNRFSHGFRPTRGHRDALGAVKAWGLSSWFMTVGIQKFLETIDQKKLISILNKSIKDQIMVDTLYKLFKMPIINLSEEDLADRKGVGIPPNNPLSFLLANIYLNEFDHFVCGLKQKVTKGVPREITKKIKVSTEVYASELFRVKTRKAKFLLRQDLY